MSNDCQIQRILNWFDEAKPEPNEKDFSVQLGVHIEEIVEMLDCFSTENPRIFMTLENAIHSLIVLSESLKANKGFIEINDPLEFLDSLNDQVVTAAGTAKFAGYDFLGSIKEVNDSNYSKFVDGKAVFNEQGKIIKGPNYFKPQLEQFIPREN